ncbi:bifunctional diguanylate cyclase/phosphodiesterase [Vibrio campbellii]|uniref:bifunctional diguanylate cyclase/phosphodiesterase n=1 Tax=Vibrio campbellii TaxID=680 RepID=UPI0005F0117A|nr:sensor domain-containing phosphodiesterase [Vibrio campbellii]
MNNIRLFNLNLRYKTALYFALGLLGMIISFLFISRYFFLYSLDELENMEISRANHQAQAVIEMMVKQQQESSYDWAYWDETYQLLKYREIEAYRERNLYIESMDTLALDMMGFITLKGETLEALTREPSQEKSLAFVSEVMSQPSLEQHVSSMNHRLDVYRESAAGLFKINQNIWVISLTPVRNSEGDKDSSGWLLWGRDLTQRFPGDFQSILSANNQLTTLDPDFLTGDLIEKSSDTISKHSVIKDIAGNPIALLKTQTERAHYEKGNALFLYLFATVGVVASIIASGTYLIFRNRVATRFNHFADGIQQIASQYQIEGLKSVSSDELDVAAKLVQKLSENNSMTALQLKDSLEKFTALYESTSLGMLIVIERQIVDANQRALDLLSYDKDIILGKQLDDLCASEDEECHVDIMFKQLQSGRNLFEAQMLNSHGTQIDCLIEATLIQHHGQNALMLLIQDQREKKQQAQLIQDLTDYDPISGFCNRPVILGALSELIAHRPNQFSFIYLSSNGLKQISEVYGHVIFDEAIQYISMLFRQEFEGYQIGRISESEFIIVIPSSDKCQFAMDSANKLLNQLAHKVEVAGLQLSLKSYAVMVDPEITHQTLDELLLVTRYSSQTMQRENGNKVQITGKALSTQAQTSMTIHRDLELAIENDNIVPYFQPILNTQTEEIIGFEALARWQHPSLGMISPAVFIPMAEQNQLIVELGESILKQSCQFISQLNESRQAYGLKNLNVHVNLSAQHFYHSSLTTSLELMFDQYQLSSGQLVLEITESMLMGIEEEVIHRINEIKQLGIQLALDDFGTGYASFSSLCSFPIDIVKLDKSYIDQIETNDRAKTLVRNIANMAQELGLTIVAEGVETMSQVRKLKVWNIDELQGFYFYKPISKLDAFTQFSGQPYI